MFSGASLPHLGAPHSSQCPLARSHVASFTDLLNSFRMLADQGLQQRIVTVLLALGINTRTAIMLTFGFVPSACTFSVIGFDLFLWIVHCSPQTITDKLLQRRGIPGQASAGLRPALSM